MSKNKKVFISYCWDDKQHQEWVINLGRRLMRDTVDVELDRWSLKEGHDTYNFMEKMVNSDDIFRVLIISDKNYTIKSNKRKGGVGTETQIISPEIYSNVAQEKFIPIVLERDENGKEYLPTFLKGRKYIDFTQEENFEDSYEELLRNILEVPAIQKPTLGTKVPTYITEPDIDIYETNSKLRVLENQIKKGTKISSKYLQDFIESFSNLLWGFKVNVYNGVDLGKMIFDQLILYKSLREDYIKFIDIISSNEVEDVEDVLVDFFGQKLLYEKPKNYNSGNYSPAEYEIFEIIFHELFIYTIAICIKNKNYHLVSDLLHLKYSLQEDYRRDITPRSYLFLYEENQYLEDYYKDNYNKITGTGYYLISNLSNLVKKEYFILADLLCYFISILERFNEKQNFNKYSFWFPQTYLYSDRNKITFFSRLSSLKFFEKTKDIFNVDSISTLRQKIIDAEKSIDDKLYYSNSSCRVPCISELLPPDTIGINR